MIKIGKQDFAMKRFTLLGVCCVAFVFSGIAGCGSEAVPGAVKTYPVNGTIALDGKPFGPARLVFTPGTAESPQPGGLVDASGKITVTTYSAGDGMPAGTYKVSISQDPTTRPPEHPLLYDNSATSTLTVTVAEKGPNDFKLDMDSKAGPAGGAASGIPGGVNLPPGVDPSKAYGPVVGPGATAPGK
jgi:hypothetical protein